VQCHVALAHLENIRLENLKLFPDKPLLLHEIPEEVATMEEIFLALSQNPKFKNNSDIEIEIKKSKSAEFSPVRLCGVVRKWAAEKRVRIAPKNLGHKDSSKPDWLIINSNDEYDWHIVQISMPVISADRKSAYFNESHYFAPLAGGGSALEYKILPNGTWELVERVGLYVS
jgi:hypothetical protein